MFLHSWSQEMVSSWWRFTDADKRRSSRPSPFGNCGSLLMSVSMSHVAPLAISPHTIRSIQWLVCLLFLTGVEMYVSTEYLLMSSTHSRTEQEVIHLSPPSPIPPTVRRLDRKLNLPHEQGAEKRMPQNWKIHHNLTVGPTILKKITHQAVFLEMVKCDQTFGETENVVHTVQITVKHWMSLRLIGRDIPLHVIYLLYVIASARLRAFMWGWT